MFDSNQNINGSDDIDKQKNEENTSMLSKEFGDSLKLIYQIIFIGTIIFMIWYTVFIIKRE